MPDERSTSAPVRLWVDLPAPDAATAGALVISGWAVRRGGLRIVEIEARVGEHRIVIPQGVHRPDVALELGEPHADWCGFEGRLAVEESAVERADLLVVRATDERGESAIVEVPVRVLPSGRPVLEVERAWWAVDRVEIEGWLIWPESAPPRSVALLLGETQLATSTPNLSRPDVARRFPAFPSRSCRGFRLSATLDPLAVSASGRAQLRVVATDAEGRALQQTAAVTHESVAGLPVATREAVVAIENAVALARERLAREPIVLDWQTGPELSTHCPGLSLFRPMAAEEGRLPYLDQSVDIVVTEGVAPERVAEARRVAAVATVEGVAIRWRFDEAQRPTLPPVPNTSIVVVARGPAAQIAAGLAHLRRTLSAEFRGEVLVVDGGSSGETSALLRDRAATWPQLRILRNEGEADFASSCNRGAELARGELLVFLGAGLLPQPGWLPPLLRLLQEDPSAGAAGGKLLSANGALQEAGRVLCADGSEAGFGRGDGEPNRSPYSFVRDVDACSSSFLAVRRATFLELGGFDPQLGRSESEGADFCLRLREKGLRVRFQPASVAVIAGSAVSAVSETSGAKPEAEERRARAASSERFRARWRKLLRNRPAPAQRLDANAHHALAVPPGTRRVLICAPRMPEFDRECGSQRLLHLVEMMQGSGWAVSYLALKSVDGDRYLRLLQQRGVAVYAGPDSLRAGDEYVDDLDELIANGRFDLAIVAFWSVAETLLPRFRSLSPATRVVVDSIDLHYLREERAALLASSHPEPAANADRRRDRRRRELDTYAAADAVLTVSTKEADLVRREIARGVPVFCVPLMEELARGRCGFRERSGLLFIGNFHHPPNLEGLEYLCAEILPRLDPSLLAAHPLSVVGNGADDHVRAAVAKIPHAKVVGWVPSVVPYLEAALVSLIPLLHGAGTKGKLIQALMVGTPNVSTSIGVEGLELEHGRHVLVADSAEEFAAAIRRLTTDPALWNRLAREGRGRIERAHGRSAVQESLLSVVGRVMKSPARGRAVRRSAG